MLKRASILTGVANSEIGCAVRNMNAEGAELIVPAEAPVLVDFLLYVPIDGPTDPVCAGAERIAAA